ncbi:hypothetical protein JXA47_17170 [Candidatus Sumerlaeota bacterium]|nr:hypothetical protein [Candidatus Sumerlaeota bacterium]
MTDPTEFSLTMVRVVMANQGEILSLAPVPDDVIFCCSPEDAGVGMVWSAVSDA